MADYPSMYEKSHLSSLLGKRPQDFLEILKRLLYINIEATRDIYRWYKSSTTVLREGFNNLTQTSVSWGASPS